MKGGIWFLALLLLSTPACRRGSPTRQSTTVAGRFQAIGPMVAARMSPRVAPLAEGRWLITSGTYAAQAPDTDTSGCTELFDPATGAFYELPAMATPRISHALAPLPGGDVLVVGGWSKGQALDSLERFRGDEGIFEPLAYKLARPRTQAQAVALPGGRVAVLGGQGVDGQPVAEVEVVDPAAGKVWVAARLAQPRGPGFQATVLEDGSVLVSGGDGKEGPLAALERVDVSRGKVTPLAPMGSARSGHAALALGDGRVLLVGGEGWDSGRRQRIPLDRVEVFEVRLGSCRELPRLPEARVQPAIAQLSDGRILVAGGWNGSGLLDSSRWWVPETGGWRSGPGLGQPRADDVLIALWDGRALLLGSGTDGAERLE